MRPFRDYLRTVEAERDGLRTELQSFRESCGTFPPGHFYSPSPDLADLRRREAELFGPVPRNLPGIDLNEQGQMELLGALAAFYPELPFPERADGRHRYWYENDMYSYSDAIFLHSMLRHVRPARLVEVGSGHSSCVTLDTRDLFLGGRLDVTFIEPFPETLLSLLQPGDRDRIELIAKPLQEVDPGVFDRLERNDILFIDSTHVSKTGSDVNRLILEVLPRLVPGVYVHFHDAFYPFEYPREWVLRGFGWNELYLLRAFLAFNTEFEIVLFNTFLEHFHEEFFQERMPLCLRNRGGSLWIRRRQKPDR
ncbi:MAG TPA: class I SAM-dependent methyltransferase [Thermoanaerobaculia bacterium]